MTTVNRNAIVPFTSAQMYALVDDIDRYPEFLPWCASSEEHERTEQEVQASLTLQWKGLHKSFTTCNRLHPHKMIEIRLVNGPFKHLEGFWKFAPLVEQGSEKGCKIQLTLEFEFINHLMSLAFSKVFEQISQQLVSAFTARAAQVYGK
jgi:ribosome-associated toxin RatA of RatAB toxin-antitoxin module